MPKIICHSPAVLTGQVGSVAFDRGEGRTDDPSMLAYFAEHADRFDVLADSPQPDDSPEDGPAPLWADLSDDELLEAYATNVSDDDVPGDREAIVAALAALDSDRE